VVVVTGGRGFLGRHIVEALVASRIDRVVVFDLPACDKRANSWIHDMHASVTSATKVDLVEGDLTNEADLARAFRGADAVIHCASPHPQHASAELLEAVVVRGTRQILAACDRLGVGSIVLTSSASVVFSGQGQFGVDETLPIPASFRDDYSRCKAQSETDVLAAGRRAATAGSGVRAVAVRPHGIFGPRDAQMVPGVCEVSSTWRGRLILGDGANIVDFTYVGNVVHGHLLALQRVHREASTGRAGGADGSVVSGRPFFITNDEPVAFWEFIGRVKAGLCYPAGFVRVPYRLALTIAQVQEAVAHTFASFSGTKPKALHLSPQRVAIAGTAHWYSCEAAKTALGYAPVWSLDDALSLTIDAYPHLRYDGAAAVTSPLDDADTHLSDGPQRSYTMEDVAEHNTEGNCWIVVDGHVYDVTQYLDTHPGGMKSLMRHAGRDATRGFHGDQHPEDAGLTLQDFRIGWINGHKQSEDASGL
jgi:sterol-4alpha-carboxylate 3-dehydrogenase (decarboxylating)